MNNLIELALKQILLRYKESDEVLTAIAEIEQLYINEPCECRIDGGVKVASTQ
jgi:hypothetical protein